MRHKLYPKTDLPSPDLSDLEGGIQNATKARNDSSKVGNKINFKKNPEFLVKSQMESEIDVLLRRTAIVVVNVSLCFGRCNIPFHIRYRLVQSKNPGNCAEKLSRVLSMYDSRSQTSRSRFEHRTGSSTCRLCSTVVDYIRDPFDFPIRSQD